MNMLRNCPFFPVPQRVIRSGTWKLLKRIAQAFYIGLLHEAERYSSINLVRSDKQMVALIGGSFRSFREARIRLKEHGLITYRRSDGGKYRYLLLDPRSGTPFGAKPSASPKTAGHYGVAPFGSKLASRKAASRDDAVQGVRLEF